MALVAYLMRDAQGLNWRPDNGHFERCYRKIKWLMLGFR